MISARSGIVERAKLKGFLLGSDVIWWVFRGRGGWKQNQGVNKLCD